MKNEPGLFAFPGRSVLFLFFVSSPWPPLGCLFYLASRVSKHSVWKRKYFIHQDVPLHLLCTLFSLLFVALYTSCCKDLCPQKPPWIGIQPAKRETVEDTSFAGEERSSFCLSLFFPLSLLFPFFPHCYRFFFMFTGSLEWLKW